MGHLRHADAYNLRMEYIERIMTSPWSDVLEVRGDYEYIAVRKAYTRRAYLKWKNKQLKKYLLNESKRTDQAA